MGFRYVKDPFGDVNLRYKGDLCPKGIPVSIKTL